jgi:hypothetical protein
MTADETTPERGQESTDVQTPEEFALEAVGALLNFHRTEAESAMHRIERRLMDGQRPRAEDVREMKKAVDGLEFVLVTYVSAATEGVNLSTANYEEAGGFELD